MKNTNKIKKGDYGYLSYKKKQALLIMLAALLVIAIVFIAGMVINGKKENIMTVVAAVLSLPAAKFAVSYFILIPHKSASASLKSKLKDIPSSIIIDYDLIVSNKTSPIGTQAIAISDKLVVALTDEKAADKTLFEESIKEFMLKDNRIVNVLLVFNEDTFIIKAKQMAANLEATEPSNAMLKNEASLLSMCL